MPTKVLLLGGLDGNILTSGVVNEGSMMKFGIGGKYLGKFPVPFDFQTNREIDLISILNVDNQLELGYVINNEFNKMPLFVDMQELIKWLNKQNNMLFAGSITNNVDSINYNQYLYGFEKNTFTIERLLGAIK